MAERNGEWSVTSSTVRPQRAAMIRWCSGCTAWSSVHSTYVEGMVARGVVAYDAAELATMVGRSTTDLPAELRRPVVHADDLVAV